MTDKASAAIRRLWPIRFSYVPPSRFYGGPTQKYLRPRRITLRGPGRIAIYRWLVWNFTIGERS